MFRNKVALWWSFLGEKRQTKRFCFIYFLFCFTYFDSSPHECVWNRMGSFSSTIKFSSIYIKMQIPHFQFLFYLAHTKKLISRKILGEYIQRWEWRLANLICTKRCYFLFYVVVSKMLASLYSIGIFILKGSPKFLNVWRMSLIWTQRVSDKVFFKV